MGGRKFELSCQVLVAGFMQCLVWCDLVLPILDRLPVHCTLWVGAAWCCLIRLLLVASCILVFMVLCYLVCVDLVLSFQDLHHGMFGPMLGSRGLG